jgi:hypothetical protein
VLLPPPFEHAIQIVLVEQGDVAEPLYATVPPLELVFTKCGDLLLFVAGSSQFESRLAMAALVSHVSYVEYRKCQLSVLLSEYGCSPVGLGDSCGVGK